MTQFINHYFCSSCKVTWQDEWDCMCDDKCPVCGKAHTPFHSDDLPSDLKEETGQLERLYL